MNTSYDFSFLTSPVNPRTDKKIAQQFPLSYLTSEPGSNYVLRFKPFTAMGVRIDRQDIKFAGHSIKNDASLLRIETASKNEVSNVKYGLVNNQSKRSIKRQLETFSQNGFWGTLEESIGIVHSIRLFEVWQLDSQTIKSDLQLSQKIGEDIDMAIVSNRQLFGSRIDFVKQSIYQLYMDLAVKYQEADMPNDFSFSIRDDETKEAAQIANMILSEKRKFRNGQKLSEVLSDKFQDRHNHTYVYNHSVISDLEFSLAEQIHTVYGEKPKGIGHSYELTNFQRHQKEHAYKFPNYINSSQTDNIGITYQYLNAEPEDLTGIRQNLVVLASKTSLSNKQAYQSERLKFLNPYEYEVLKYQSLILGQKPSINSRPNIMHHKLFERYSKEVSVVQDLFAYNRDEKISQLTNLHTWIDTKLEKRVKGSIVNDGTRHLDDFAKEVQIEDELILTNNLPIEAKSDAADLVIVSGLSMHAVTSDHRLIDFKNVLDTYNHQKDLTLLDDLEIYARVFDIQDRKLDNVGIDGRIVNQLPVYVDFLPLDAQTTNTEFGRIDKKIEVDARIEWGDFLTGYELLPLIARYEEDVYTKTDKIRLNAWIIYALETMSPLQKASLILEYEPLFDKVVRDSYYVKEKAQMDLMDKIAKPSLVMDDVLGSIKQQRDSKIIEVLLLDKVKLEAYFYDMLFGDRPDIFESIISKHLTAAGREDIEGIIRDTLTARNENHQRDAHIPEEKYTNARDLSAWDDIWNMYSPGVDVIDVPNSDYDYSQLTATVYDLATGVPHKPLSPLNVPNVKVKTPLHNPIPQFFDVGTNEVVVDNYVIIDVILAIESLKNRSKLRYAGMPAEKALQELLSKLWTWIQQAAPGDEQYIRTFRMARWYMEHAIVKLSEHILHREYSDFTSTLHKGTDLGIPYTSAGWTYYPTSYILRTTSISARLAFDYENYIDSTFKIRGYFDNPLLQGTMEVKVDGVRIDLITGKGSFEKEYDLPMGHHTYEFIFRGASGIVSLSSIVIGGSVFEKAWTTSDDSNTNGLKAATLLVNMLVSYFEKHHGNYKIKGTMEIKQRKLWQVT